MSSRTFTVAVIVVVAVSVIGWLVWWPSRPRAPAAKIGWDIRTVRVEAGKVIVAGRVSVAPGWSVQGPLKIWMLASEGGVAHTKTVTPAADGTWGPAAFAEVGSGQFNILVTGEFKHDKYSAVHSINSPPLVVDVP